MLSWTSIVIMSSFLAGVGFAIDKFLLKSHKTKLHDYLERFWLQLSYTTIPKLPLQVAKWGLIVINKIFGKKKRIWRGVVIIFFASIILTYFSFSVSLRLAYDQSEFSFLNPFIPAHPITYSLYFFNFLFDFITIFVTYKVLKKISLGKGITSIWIVFDFIIAYLCALLSGGICWIIFMNVFYGINTISADAILNLLDEFIRMFNSFWSSIFDAITTEERSISYYLFKHPHDSASDHLDYIGSILVSLTSFLPTIIFLIFISFLSIGKLIISIFRKFILYFLERAIEDEPEKLQVFGLTATFFSVLAILFKTLSFFVN